METMGIFKDNFTLLKKASEPLYKTPKSVQQTIEILKISEGGIFEVAPGKYSKQDQKMSRRVSFKNIVNV